MSTCTTIHFQWVTRSFWISVSVFNEYDRYTHWLIQSKWISNTCNTNNNIITFISVLYIIRVQYIGIEQEGGRWINWHYSQLAPEYSSLHSKRKKNVRYVYSIVFYGECLLQLPASSLWPRYIVLATCNGKYYVFWLTSFFSVYQSTQFVHLSIWHRISHKVLSFYLSAIYVLISDKWFSPCPRFMYSTYNIYIYI